MLESEVEPALKPVYQPPVLPELKAELDATLNAKLKADLEGARCRADGRAEGRAEWRARGLSCSHSGCHTIIDANRWYVLCGTVLVPDQCLSTVHLNNSKAYALISKYPRPDCAPYVCACPYCEVQDYTRNDQKQQSHHKNTSKNSKVMPKCRPVFPSVR